MFQLPKLPYSYDALEPFIDRETMELHHNKHHNTYVERLNKVLESHESLTNKTIEDLLSDFQILPHEIRTAIRNFGGGHYNHTLFWGMMKNKSEGEAIGKVAKEIEKKYGSYKSFEEQFSNKANGIFGSGWAWLILNKDHEFDIISTKNQDSPIMEGLYPILGLDVWEHAYYLKYQNKRADYVAAWWNVVNWERVENLYGEAIR